MNKIKVLCFSSFIMIVVSGLLYAQRFTSYYTKLDDNYDALEMVEDKLFGKYADLIVEMGDLGTVEFSRKTSYLPQFVNNSGTWTFPELIRRSGDGGEIRPDIISKYSGVRLIDNNKDSITVHWRYFPDFQEVGWGGVVDEYFYFSPDGVVVRTSRKGTPQLAEWENHSTMIYKAYKLGNTGIRELKFNPEKVNYDPNFTPVNSKTIDIQDRSSKIYFPFNDGSVENSEIVTELKSGNRYQILGNKAIWRKGISGSALQFDGYYSAINLDDSIKLPNSDAITIESWVALGAYPFGWAPLVHQSEWGVKGFYLGISEDGFPGFHISINGTWFSAVDSTQLGLSKWYNVTGTYSPNSGHISLFINGERVSIIRSRA